MAKKIDSKGQRLLFDFQVPDGETLNLNIDPALKEYLIKNSANTYPYHLNEISSKDWKDGIIPIFWKGNIDFINQPAVAVVGTRNPTERGIAAAKIITETLVKEGFVVVSGLAKGIDSVAHSCTLSLGGKTIGVLGTPIHQIYPAQNKKLGEEITDKGLLLSISRPEEGGNPYVFPRRNRLMALLTKATIIVEAGETSGVVHQAAECARLNRKLIFSKVLAEQNHEWVNRFMRSASATVINGSADLRSILQSLNIY